ncbi:MAG TPA: hypothetical protein VM120_27245 [Bryobacteraceae bacterium]|nr:hypothetical protein [Bryobacteraceae bacterium]
MTDAAWNLRRVARLESELYGQAAGDPLISEDDAIYRRAMGLLRYKIAHDRIYHRAYKQFTALQNHRLNNEIALTQPPSESEPEPAPPASPTPETNQTQEAVIDAAQRCLAEVDREIASTKDFIANFSGFLNMTKMPRL